MKRSIELSGKSLSTLTNYARCLATMTLHFKCSPLDLDSEQVLDYLHYLQSKKKTPSSSYFKHTLYGLRFVYKLYGKAPLLQSLPSLKKVHKLPVVLSVSEIKRLITAPKLLKHRLLIALMYGCGLRRSELMNIRLTHADLDRQMLHISQGKGRKDRYVPLGENLCYAIGKYLDAVKPYIWLFNGNGSDGTPGQFSANGVRWIISEARKKAGIQKQISSHILRHTYATHLLEMGTDIMTLKDLLGHMDIKTTMLYLHICNLDKQKAFSPMDRIYKIK
ncbi:MAG: tyrosine-type recombinase/integrase [Gammaproteobacteria bacterium]|nr:tyrosine-type recombinase/integrase [Gammaproteobacteria bacterium]